MKKINTIIIPIIRPDFLRSMLMSLHFYTEPNFYVYVIDQTGTDEAQKQCESLTHMWIRPYRNLGFSKAMNTGIVLAQTEYITLANDDLEFLDKRWWDGVLDTFAMDKRIVAVNPNSPKEGAFGYGLTSENHDTWKPKEGIGLIRDPEDPECVIPDIQIGNGQYANKDFYQTPEGYTKLLNDHPHWQKGTLNDAIAMWCTVFKRNALLNELGLLDEHFYPGSGEDYDMNGRAYSCAWPEERETCDESQHKRMVGTTKSWVWHHWGKSKEVYDKKSDNALFSSRSYWNNMGILWPDHFDVWGHHENEQGIKTPNKRISEVFIDDL